MFKRPSLSTRLSAGATTVAAALLLAACAGNGQPEKHPDSPMVGMSNPASEFCIKQGGKLETKKDAEGGEYALCHLPDGTVVEEWEYFRSHNGQ